jgi:leucyl-tRNA synthetase
VKDYGADALRLYEMFMGPLEAVKPWQTSQIQGVVRFRDRLDLVCHQPLGDGMDDATRRLLHQTVRKVTRDIEAMAFNTAISALMVFVNHLGRLPATPRAAAETLVLLVSPFAPHVAEELWRHLGHADSLAYEAWPTWDERLIVDDVVAVPVQVNGKVRGLVHLARDASEADARAAVLAAEEIAARLAGQAVRKFVYVPGKIVSLVVD